MINFEQAQKKLINLCQHWRTEIGLQSESRALNSSVGFHLAQPIYAGVDLPGENLSAMDGYGLCVEGFKVAAKPHQTFSLCGESRAGEPYRGELLKANQCIRIMTGAVVPQGVDRVVMQENTELNDQGDLALLQEVAAGSNIRQRGEEIRVGQKLFEKDQVITASILPALASQGIDRINTYRQLRVALFATGDELRKAGDKLAVGDIYESNLQAIEALFQGLPIEIHNVGIIPDQPEAIRSCLQQASENYDVVISSGGVSVGDYDYVRDCVQTLGEVETYKVAMKPGKPLCFGTLGKPGNHRALFFGLPGNAVSSFVTLTELFMPGIYTLLGEQHASAKLRLTAVLENRIRKKPGRLEFQRGILESKISEQGVVNWSVTGLTGQDSHRVYQLAKANCTIILSEEIADVEAGSSVMVAPFPWCFNG